MIVSEKYDEAAVQIWKLTRLVSTRIELFLIGKNKYNSVEVSPLNQIIKEKGIEIA